MTMFKGVSGEIVSMTDEEIAAREAEEAAWQAIPPPPPLVKPNQIKQALMNIGFTDSQANAFIDNAAKL